MRLGFGIGINFPAQAAVVGGPPAFTAQPSFDAASYASGDTVTIDLGAANGGAALAIETFTVGGVDRSGEISGSTWTGAVTDSSTIELVVSATNGEGVTLSDTITATYYAFPAFVGASAAITGSATAGVVDSATIDLTTIAGLQEGDVVVVQYSRASQNPQTVEIADASWLSELDQSRADGDDSSVLTAVKAMGASPDPSVTIETTTTDAGANSRIAFAHAYRGVNSSDLDVVLRAGATLNNTAHVSFNPVTPTVPGSIVVVNGHSSLRGNLAAGHPTVSAVLSDASELIQNAGNRDISVFMGHSEWDGAGTYDPGQIDHANTAATNSMASVMRVFEPAEPGANE